MKPKSALFVLIALSLVAPGAFAQEPEADPPVAAPDPARMQADLKKAKEALAALEKPDLETASRLLDGAPITADELEAWLGAVGLRAKALEALANRRAPEDETALKRRLGALKSDRAKLEALQPEDPSERVTEVDLDPRKVRLETLKQEVERATRALEGLVEERDRIGAQVAELPERVAGMGKQVEGDAPEGDLPKYERRTLELELWHARLMLADARVFLGALEILTQVRDQEVQLAREQLARQDEFLKAARAIIEERNRQDRKYLETKARQLETDAGNADDPVTRQKLLIEAEVAWVLADTVTDESWLGRIRALKAAQEARNSRLEALKRRIDSRFREGSAVSARSAELLRIARRRIEDSMEQLRNELRPALEEEYDDYLKDRAELQDRLWEIEEPLDEDRQEGTRKAYLASRATLKAALDARYNGKFGDIDDELSAIEALYDERGDLLDGLSKELLSRIIWIRSDPPLGPGILDEVREEIVEVGEALTGGSAPEEPAAETEGKTGRILLVVGGIVGLIVFGLILFFRLRTHEVRHTTRGGRVLGIVQRIVIAMVVSAIAPAFLIGASLLLGLLGLPGFHDRLGTSLLRGLAGILFVRRFSRALFRPNGILVEDLGGAAEVARQLFGFFRWVTAGLVVLWLPWWLLKGRVFDLDHLPRLIYTVMLVFFAFLLLGLVKPHGAVVSQMSGRKGLWYRAWRVLYPVVALGMVAIIAMDALGYRTGAALLADNVLQTFAAAFILFGLYHLITAIFRQALPRLGSRWWAEESGESTARLSEEVQQRMTRFAGLVAVVVGIVLLASFWGFDQQIKGMLESVHIATVDSEKGITLSLWNVVLSLAWILGAHLVARNLGAFYKATLFTRLEASDPGSRYVIVAVSRYLILIVGYSAAVLGLHISFSSLGWILAAASVGLGFGLQEIVSNFVSGLILFVERPIKVGDFVTVGTTLGTVDKINIRATQVISRDRKVIIIPNRLFISEQVVNWSHNDNLVRTTINVGVAYGTDVEKARDILLDIVKKHPLVQQNPPPQALLLTFGSSSLDIQVRIFSDIVDRRRVENEVNTEITRRFEEAGIEIPFPQQDLHIRTGSDRDLLDALHHVSEPEEEQGEE